MPLLDSGDKICHPKEVKSIKLNDVVIIRPVQVVVKNKYVVFPPLSLVSEECENEIKYPTWVEGYRIQGDEDIELLNGNESVEGEINIHDFSLITAYSLVKLLGNGKANLWINKDYKSRGGVVILTLSNSPLVMVENRGRRVIVTTQNYEILFKLFAYSIFYYTRPSSSSEL